MTTPPENSIFSKYRVELPDETYRTPDFKIEGGKPSWVLIDDMGIKHRFQDGCTLTDARFSFYNLAGILIDNIVLDTVCFASCNLENTEFQHATLRQVLITGGEGGPVFKSSKVTDCCVQAISDPKAVLRFFECRVDGLIMTDLQCGLDIARTDGENMTLQSSNFAGLVTIRHSNLRATKIVACTFTDAVILKVTLLESTLVDCNFNGGRWNDVDISLSIIRSTNYKRTNIHNLRADVTSIQSLRLERVLAVRISASFSEWVDIKVTDSIINLQLDDCQVRSLALWKVVLDLRMKRTQCYCARLCDVTGSIQGQEVMFWRPVLRRSKLRGDGKRGITLISADCTSTTTFTKGFAIWINADHVTKEGEQTDDQ